MSIEWTKMVQFKSESGQLINYMAYEGCVSSEYTTKIQGRIEVELRKGKTSGEFNVAHDEANTVYAVKWTVCY